MAQSDSRKELSESKSNRILILPTHECNRTCSYCVDQLGRKLFANQYISMENIDKAIRFAKQHKKEVVELSGGEPTLHPQIVEIARRIKDAGFHIKMHTNGDFPDVIYQLNGLVDRFVISFRNQKNLPYPKDFPNTEIVLYSLLDAERFPTLQSLDEIIDRYGDTYILKFRTLFDVNDYCIKNQTPFLNELDALGTNSIMEDKRVKGPTFTEYRGYNIRRIDIPSQNLTDDYVHPIVEPDGTISYYYPNLNEFLTKVAEPTQELISKLRTTSSPEKRNMIIRDFLNNCN